MVKKDLARHKQDDLALKKVYARQIKHSAATIARLANEAEELELLESAEHVAATVVAQQEAEAKRKYK
jgi:hypothetical protein